MKQDVTVRQRNTTQERLGSSRSRALREDQGRGGIRRAGRFLLEIWSDTVYAQRRLLEWYRDPDSADELRWQRGWGGDRLVGSRLPSPVGVPSAESGIAARGGTG